MEVSASGGTGWMRRAPYRRSTMARTARRRDMLRFRAHAQRCTTSPSTARPAGSVLPAHRSDGHKKGGRLASPAQRPGQSRRLPKEIPSPNEAAAGTTWHHALCAHPRLSRSIGRPKLGSGGKGQRDFPIPRAQRLAPMQPADRPGRGATAATALLSPRSRVPRDRRPGRCALSRPGRSPWRSAAGSPASSCRWRRCRRR
jgi:hypothetical protein